jgi:hypothetical protein
VLDLDQRGRPRLTLESNGAILAQRTGGKPIADAVWHHLLVEVDRARPDGIAIFIDGVRDAGEFTGKLDASDLGNGGDVLVGGGPDRAFLRADIDFMRVCLGTLAEAHTTIDELRAWQFSGPQFFDFAGNVRPIEQATAGAFEPDLP